MSRADLSFGAMGCHVRLIIGEPGPGAADRRAARSSEARAFVDEFEDASRGFGPTASSAR